MSTCTSTTTDKLNAMRPAKGGFHADGIVVTVVYGPYMNCGRWNHNTSRIEPLIEKLNALGWNVQLMHDPKETTWPDHGDVTIKYFSKVAEKEVTLCHANRVQHNHLIRSQGFADMARDAKKVMDGLISAKATKIMATAKAHEDGAAMASASGASSSNDNSTKGNAGDSNASAVSLDSKM